MSIVFNSFRTLFSGMCWFLLPLECQYSFRFVRVVLVELRIKLCLETILHNYVKLPAQHVPNSEINRA